MLQVREIRGAAAGLAVVALYMSLVLASGLVNAADFGRLLLLYLTASFSLWLVVGSAIVLVRLALAARDSGSEAFLLAYVQNSTRERWQRDRCVSLMWPPLLFALLLSSFNAFKQMILPLAGFRYDALMGALDRALFLGQDPWRVTHALFGGDFSTLLIDRAYHGWFLPMSVGLVVCAFLPSSAYRLRTQYMLTYIGVWIGIGSVLAFLVPAAGPCFTSQFVASVPSFDALHDRLLGIQAATGSPLAALRNQALLVEAFGSRDLRVGGGISAMPSVHCALAALFALGASRLNRFAGGLFAAYACVIWLGSIHLGWHYAVDGLVAVALTLGIWKVAGRIADILDAPTDQRVPQPLPAH